MLFANYVLPIIKLEVFFKKLRKQSKYKKKCLYNFSNLRVVKHLNKKKVPESVLILYLVVCNVVFGKCCDKTRQLQYEKEYALQKQ